VRATLQHRLGSYADSEKCLVTALEVGHPGDAENQAGLQKLLGTADASADDDAADGGGAAGLYADQITCAYNLARVFEARSRCPACSSCSASLPATERLRKCIGLGWIGLADGRRTERVAVLVLEQFCSRRRCSPSGC
jgi:hypothetical protein